MDFGKRRTFHPPVGQRAKPHIDAADHFASGVEPYRYLKDVLERSPTMTNQQVAQLTPLHWKKSHQLTAKLAA
jgi:hypothetical protein